MALATVKLCVLVFYGAFYLLKDLTMNRIKCVSVVKHWMLCIIRPSVRQRGQTKTNQLHLTSSSLFLKHVIAFVSLTFKAGWSPDELVHISAN